MKKLLTSLTLISFSLPGIFAQQSFVSATGHITAEVIPIFSATELAQLNFGKFSPGPHGGKIILAPNNTVVVMGSVYKGPGTYNAASFYLSGDSETSFTITLPLEPVVLKHVASAKVLTIEDWNSYPGIGTGSGILQNGEMIVHVGATLNIGSLQDNPVGVYSGTYTINFDFN